MISLKTGGESFLGELKKLGCFDIQLYITYYTNTLCPCDANKWPSVFQFRFIINSFSRLEFNTRVNRSVVRYDKYLDKISSCFEFVHFQYK